MSQVSVRHLWGVAALVLLVGGIAAAIAYNAGLSQGVAQVPVPAGSVLPYAYGYGWHRPWGFGFLFGCVRFGPPLRALKHLVRRTQA